MSWITDLFTDVAGTAVKYGGEFLDPTNLAKSLGTAGVMSLFGGNSDDFARNFLMSNLGRTAGNIRKSELPQSKSAPLSLSQQYSKLNPADKLKMEQNFSSGKLNEKQFNDYVEAYGETGRTYEDYVRILGQDPALSSAPPINPDPFNQETDQYGGMLQNASYNSAAVPVNSANKKAEVVNYDISNFLDTSKPSGIAAVQQQGVQQQGPMGTEFITKQVPGGTTATNPTTGKIIFTQTGFAPVVLQEASKKAPGFGEGVGYFTDRIEKFDETMFGKLALEAINPDYYKRRDFEQEAEDKDKRLRNQFRQETLNPARSGFARNMRSRRYASGGIADLQSGGAANGPGTGTSDSIPARLSDGEFVMTAEAVKNMGNGSRQKGTRKMYDLMNNLERRM